MYNNIATNDGSKERVLTYIWVLEMPSLYRVMCQASILRLICKCSTFINIDWVLHTIPVLFEKAQASGIFFYPNPLSMEVWFPAFQWRQGREDYNQCNILVICLCTQNPLNT